MRRILQTQRGARRRGRTVTAGLSALVGLMLLTGCESLSPRESGLLTRDMYDVKTKLDKYLDQQTSSDRQVKYSLNSIDENLQGRNEVIKTALDDLEKRLRDQAAQIDKLSSQLEALSFAVDALSKRLNMGGALTPGEASGAGTTTAPVPGAGGTVTNPAAATSIDQLMASGQRLFNLMNYSGARDEFQRALEQNPQGDNRVEILYWLAESCFKLNDLENAKKHYADVIRTNNTHVKAWSSVEQLARIYLASGNRDDNAYGLQLLQEIVAKNPRYPEIERVKATIAQIQQAGGAAPGGTPAPDTNQQPTSGEQPPAP